MRWYSRTGTHSENVLATALMTTARAWEAAALGFAVGAVDGLELGARVGVGAGAFDAVGAGGGVAVVGVHMMRTALRVGPALGSAVKSGARESADDWEAESAGWLVAVAIAVSLLDGLGEPPG